MPALASRFGLHPAHTYSVLHQRDVAVVMRLAISGALDGRVVNATDDAPVTVFEMALLAGEPIEGSAEPLRELGFRPTVPTIQGAAAAGIL